MNLAELLYKYTELGFCELKPSSPEAFSSLTGRACLKAFLPNTALCPEQVTYMFVTPTGNVAHPFSTLWRTTQETSFKI